MKKSTLEDVNVEDVTKSISLIFEVDGLRRDVDSSVRTFYRLMRFVEALMQREQQGNPIRNSHIYARARTYERRKRRG